MDIKEEILKENISAIDKRNSNEMKCKADKENQGENSCCEAVQDNRYYTFNEENHTSIEIEESFKKLVKIN